MLQRRRLWLSDRAQQQELTLHQISDTNGQQFSGLSLR